MHLHGPAATCNGEAVNVKVRHLNDFVDDGGAAHRDVFCRDVSEGSWVDSLHGDVASRDGVEDGIGT